MTDNQAENKAVKNSNGKVAIACVAFVGAMVGVSYAAVPLYEIFCQVTGYGGTTSRVEQASDVILDQKIKIRFDANVSGDLPWDFKPKVREIEIAIGETAQIEYLAKNIAGMTTNGQATFNVTPQSAGAYFNKVECFCFTETDLEPGESLDMPVIFFVDPEIVDYEETKDIKTITLSYTFFSHESEKPVAALSETVDAEKKL
ncbi:MULTISPECIES: cytochrome c oxidase assembly protein [unclassified Lentilitoribacter]|jgi:cytochrome c oxidase assembly protein subunit 11|uniref:cytochrome c oxidase assembly protein n=1 Tax=unclassified Lentilitoribacter TaxID=2647570 RepID=UPI0013A69D27|nr:cytochrome c oxidase assembly protein [Lentilitoribacter sp. Alg239-R112]